MKYLISTILLLSIVFTSFAKTILEGNLPKDSGTQYQIYIKEVITDVNNENPVDEVIQVNEKNKFKFKHPILQPGFYSLTVVMDKEDGNKYNYNTTVYLDPKKVDNKLCDARKSTHPTKLRTDKRQ